MIIVYRMCAYTQGYEKKKLFDPNNKEKCMTNFLSVWRGKDISNTDKMIIMVDKNRPDPKLDAELEAIELTYGKQLIVPTTLGSSGKSFRYAFEYILNSGYSPEEVVFFLEDDYIFLPNARTVLLEGLTRANYVTLYCHPDKFTPASQGGNPEVDDGGSTITRIFKTASAFWALCNSTTMTFATTVKILHEDTDIIRKHTNGDYPTDYQMFLELREKGRTLIQPLPTFATHTEIAWLAPLIGTGINSWSDV